MLNKQEGKETFDIVHPDTFKRYTIRDMVIKGYEDLKVVEFVVIGDNRSWPLWAEYDSFKRVNPDLKVPDW